MVDMGSRNRSEKQPYGGGFLRRSSQDVLMELLRCKHPMKCVHGFCSEISSSSSLLRAGPKVFDYLSVLISFCFSSPSSILVTFPLKIQFSVFMGTWAGICFDDLCFAASSLDTEECSPPSPICFCLHLLELAACLTLRVLALLLVLERATHIAPWGL